MTETTATDAVLLEEQTWQTTEAAIEAGTDTVIIPVGSVEQHGPHLPLATDAVIGEELAKRIAQNLGDAFVAPTVRPGCSNHHMDFSGTITIPASTLMDILHAYCDSLAQHGFETVVFLPSHGGNFAPVNTVAPEIAEQTDLNVVALADLDRYMDLMNEGMQKEGLDPEPVIHAGGTETSAVLAIRPALVRKEALEPGRTEAVNTSLLLAKGFKPLTKNGVLGDPRQSSEEAGKAILEAVSQAYTEDVKAGRAAFE